MNLKLAEIIESIPEDFVKTRSLKDSVTFSKGGCSGESVETVTVSWFTAGEPFALYFRKDGHYHRIGGPARVIWLENGQIFREEWYLNGSHHRNHFEGPAVIFWDDLGKKTLESYIEHNMLVNMPTEKEKA